MKPKPRAIPCAFCKQSLVERTDKNGKPYFICDDCGIQLFVRGVIGRRLLDEVVLRNSPGFLAPITRIEASSLKTDLDDLCGYIEVFCEDEVIIRDEARPIESQILLTEWANEVCERIESLVSKATKPDKTR